MTNYPTLSYISNITNAKNAVVTFTESHDFTLGEIVSFRVTPDFGMFEINQRRARVTSKTDDTITVDLNTQHWTPFSLDNLDEPGTTPPTCIPSSSGVVPERAIPATNEQDAFDTRIN